MEETSTLKHPENLIKEAGGGTPAIVNERQLSNEPEPEGDLKALLDCIKYEPGENVVNNILAYSKATSVKKNK